MGDKNAQARALKKKRKGRAIRRWIKRIVVLAAVLVAGLFGLRAYIRSQADNAQGETYAHVSVVRGEMSETVYGTGTTSARSQPNLLAEADGTLTELRVEIGDEVKRGDVLAVLTNEDLDDTITDLEFKLWDLDSTITSTASGSTVRTIEAPVAGRIMALYAGEGDDALAVFRREGALAVISTDGRMRVELSNLKSGSVAIGQGVTVTGESFSIEGTVTDVTRQGTQATVTVIDDTLPMDAPVSVADMQGKVLGEGLLVINKPMAVSSYGGTISSVRVAVGDKVTRGATLFRLEDSPLTLAIENLRIQREAAAKELKDAKDRRENLIILAPCDGVMATLEVKEGDDITNGMLLGSILEGEEMNLTIAVDELDVVQVEPGQSVVVTVDALGSLELPGTVSKIAPVGNSAGGVTSYDVELTIDAVGSGVRSGMNATGEITVATAQDALYVPVEALMTIGNETYVMVEGDGSVPAFADAQALEGGEFRATQGTDGARPDMPERGDMPQGEAAGADGERQRGERNGGNREGNAQGGRRGDRNSASQEASEAQSESSGILDKVKSFAQGIADGFMAWLYDGVQTADTQVSGTLVRVEKGLQNDDYVQILSGVSEGDIVLYTVQEQTSGFGFMGMNMGGGGAPGGNMGGGNRR